MTQPSASAKPARSWAIVALVGIALYVLSDVALAVLRPDYSLLRNYESDYGRGRFAWLMDVNFLLRGVFSVCAAIALRRAGVAGRVSVVLMWVWAAASALLAFFPDNPAGYPVLASGRVHLLLAGVAFVAIAVATLLMSFRHGARAGVAQRVLAVVGAVASVLVLHPFGVGGLVERVFLAAEIAWVVVALVFLASPVSIRAARGAALLDHRG